MVETNKFYDRVILMNSKGKKVDLILVSPELFAMISAEARVYWPEFAHAKFINLDIIKIYNVTVIRNYELTGRDIKSYTEITNP